jgi:hypothetical protein
MWCVKLTDSQRDSLRALIREHHDPARALTGALEALDLARWDDLPDASLPWDRVSDLAARQGIGEADVVWDLAAGLPPTRAAPRTARRARPRPAPQ